jgi:hypothetical protein
MDWTPGSAYNATDFGDCDACLKNLHVSAAWQASAWEIITMPRNKHSDSWKGSLGISLISTVTLLLVPACLPIVDRCAGVDCDDNDPCTVDSCAVEDGEAVCQYEPVDCPEGRVCHPESGECVGCLEDADCDDDLFCNGVEACGQNNTCVPGDDPCTETALCNEETDACVDCLTDADCDDDVFCNGQETCDPVIGQCVGGAPPCADRICVEETDACVNCLTDADCDDDLFCTGVETCDPETGACIPGTDPCLEGEFCVEGNKACLECLSDEDCPDGQLCAPATGRCIDVCLCISDQECDDGDPCTVNTCVDCQCVSTPKDCDDHLFCNGYEYCDSETGECVSPGNPCGEGKPCDEVGDACA